MVTIAAHSRETGQWARSWDLDLGRARRAGEGQIALLAHRAHLYFNKRVLEWARLTVSGKESAVGVEHKQQPY